MAKKIKCVQYKFGIVKLWITIQIKLIVPVAIAQLKRFLLLVRLMKTLFQLTPPTNATNNIPGIK
jgi:hypothetical protein